MKAYTKVLILAALGVSCLTLNTGAQQPATAGKPVVPPATSPEDHLLTPLYIPGASYDAQWGNRLSATSGFNVLKVYAPADADTLNLTKQLSEAKSDGDKEKIKEKLKELLLKQFDEKQKRHEKELEALEAQVKKLKEMVGKRQDNKKDIVEERMKQLQRDALGLGW